LCSIDCDVIPYEFGAFNKDGVLCSIEDYNFYDLEKVQEAVEAFLLYEGILHENDVIEYLD